MKRLNFSVLVLIVLISFSGCAPSQEQLLLEKQQKEKTRLEKIDKQKKAKALEVKMHKEAKQYLNSSSDNDTVWTLLEQNNGKYKKSPYETKSEYKQRIASLNTKIFDRKFIFDYKSEYIMYDPNNKTLGIIFNIGNKKKAIRTHYRREDIYQLYFNMAKQLQWAPKSKHSGEVLIKKYRYITANSNTLNTEKFQTNEKRTQLGVVIKDNCSAEDAKNIQQNWNVKFIVDISATKHMDLGTKPWSYSLPIAKIKMIIVYDKKTNEIYKVLY